MRKLHAENNCEDHIVNDTAQMILGNWKIINQSGENYRNYQLEKLSPSNFEYIDYTFFPNSKFEKNYLDNHYKEDQVRRKSFGAYTIKQDNLLRLHYFNPPGFTTEFVLKSLNPTTMEMTYSKTIIE